MRVEAEAAAREPRGRGQAIPLRHQEGPLSDFSFATPFTFSREIRLTSRFYQTRARSASIMSISKLTSLSLTSFYMKPLFLQLFDYIGHEFHRSNVIQLYITTL